MSEYIIGNDGDESILDLGEFELRFQERERIVRCRDCKYCIANVCISPDGDGDYLRFEVLPDGFCAWGEKRSE